MPSPLLAETKETHKNEIWSWEVIAKLNLQKLAYWTV